MNIAKTELIDRATFMLGMVEVTAMRVRHNSQGAKEAEAKDAGDG